MKRFLVFILIGAFLFPAFGHVFAAPMPTPKPIEVSQSPAVTPVILDQNDINTQLQNISDTLTDLIQRTQDTINQINSNDIDTSKAQNTIDAAKSSLFKAKATINLPKYSAKLAEDQFQDVKTNILLTLTTLKSSLPTLDQSGQ